MALAGGRVDGARTLRIGLAALLVASAVVFALASRAERNQEHVEQAVVAEGSETAHSDGGRGEAVVAPHAEAAETLFGVRTESAATAVGVVLASFVAAGLAVVARRRWWLWPIAVFALALAVLDAREASHQSTLGHHGLVAVALGLAVAHAVAAVAAGLSGRSRLGLGVG